MTLQEYREKIDRLINGKPGLMLNGSEEHAAIIVERMFAHAEDRMQILTRRLDPAIYSIDPVVEQAKSFASNPNGQTQILVEDISDQSLKLHDMYELTALANFEIRRLPIGMASQIGFNYSVMDRRGYRYENDKSKVDAIVRFDDEEFAEEASQYFDKLWRISTPVPGQGDASPLLTQSTVA